MSFPRSGRAGSVQTMVNRLGRRGRQTLLVLHYVTSVGWLGGGFAQLTLNLIALATGDQQLRHAAHEIAHLFDVSMLTVLSLGAATTGVLLSVRGKWGLLGYWWIVVKSVVTVLLIVGIPVFVGPRIHRAVLATMDGTGDSGYRQVRDELLVSSMVIVATLLLVTVVSVIKPWGRTPIGQRRRTPQGKARGAGAIHHPPLGDNQFP